MKEYYEVVYTGKYGMPLTRTADTYQEAESIAEDLEEEGNLILALKEVQRITVH